jgi:hypothetical protein
VLPFYLCYLNSPVICKNVVLKCEQFVNFFRSVKKVFAHKRPVNKVTKNIETAQIKIVCIAVVKWFSVNRRH